MWHLHDTYTTNTAQHRPDQNMHGQSHTHTYTHIHNQHSKGTLKTCASWLFQPGTARARPTQHSTDLTKTCMDNHTHTYTHTQPTQQRHTQNVRILALPARHGTCTTNTGQHRPDQNMHGQSHTHTHTCTHIHNQHSKGTLKTCASWLFSQARHVHDQHSTAQT